MQGVRQCRANSSSSEIPRTCQKYANVWDLEVLSEEGDAQGIQEETKEEEESQTVAKGEVATYHHDLEHLTVPVQVKRHRCG